MYVVVFFCFNKFGYDEKGQKCIARSRNLRVKIGYVNLLKLHPRLIANDNILIIN